MRKEGANSGKGPELAEIIEPSRQFSDWAIMARFVKMRKSRSAWLGDQP